MAYSEGILAGELAIVTGAASGIGRATCQILSREGAIVIAADKNVKGAKETVEKLTSPGAGNSDHSFILLDVSSSKSVQLALAEIMHQYNKPPTVVVNSAGIIRNNCLLEMAENEFDDVINVNLKGTYLVMQAFSKAMVDAKVAHGSIVNISSIVAFGGNLRQTNYAGSKAGIIGMTITAAKELGPLNIRVNAILPGMIDTAMAINVPESVKSDIANQTPLKRLGNPEEIGEVIAFLCSGKSSFMTGTAINVAGGFSL